MDRIPQSFETLHYNLLAFSKLTAGPIENSGLLSVAILVGEFFPYLLIVLFGLAWLGGGERRRRTIFIAVLAATIGIGLNLAIATLLPQPRPFELGLGLNYLRHVPEASFPSDHATLVWSLGLGLLASGSVIPAAIVIAAGVAVAWARVFLGVHFPLDMVGSLVVAIASALVARVVGPWLYSTAYLPVADRFKLRFREVRRSS